MAHRYARPQAAAPSTTGTHLGKVTKVDGPVCFVELPRVAKGFQFGPAPYPSQYDDLEAGDRVAVTFLQDTTSDLVVVVRLA